MQYSRVRLLVLPDHRAEGERLSVPINCFISIPPIIELSCDHPYPKFATNLTMCLTLSLSPFDQTVRGFVRCMGSMLVFVCTLTTAETMLPSKSQRIALFDALVIEIERLDGDGLINRHTRPESWRQTTARLREAAATASSPIEYGQVFHRLRATYPNFHAGVSIAEPFRAAWMQSDAKLPILI